MQNEFDLIKSLCAALPLDKNVNIVVPNGDDAAVTEIGDKLIAVTTDCMVEGVHFDRSFISAAQLGRKAIEAAASDIIAVGGDPTQCYLSLFLPLQIEEQYLVEVYRGVGASLKRLGVTFMGGNTSRARELILSVTILGEIPERRYLLRRSGAKARDNIYVTGNLGGSAAGLYVLQNKIEGYDGLKRKHLEPYCRSDIIGQIREVASAAIDLSDGLTSDLRHLCEASKVGARLRSECLPINTELRELSAASGLDSLELALNGGEEYEILFTSAERLSGDFTLIGQIIEGSDVFLDRNGVQMVLPPKGYNHLNSKI